MCMFSSQHQRHDIAFVALFVPAQVLVLLSEGVATPWQVTTGPFREMLQRAALESVDMTCKALAELSALRMHIKDLADAFIDQLSGIKQEATLTADKPTVVAAAQYKVCKQSERLDGR